MKLHKKDDCFLFQKKTLYVILTWMNLNMEMHKLYKRISYSSIDRLNVENITALKLSADVWN